MWHVYKIITLDFFSIKIMEKMEKMKIFYGKNENILWKK
jgi:hypothetical protein